MSRQSWQETLIQSSSDGPAITNSTTQATLLNPGEKLTLPANFLQVGSILKVTGQGRISNVVTTPGTLLFQLLFGGTAVFNNAAATIALNTTAKTNVACWMELLLTCRAIGTAANLMGQLTFQSESVVGAAAGVANTAMLPASAPAVGSNFDSTVAQQIDLQAKFSVLTATTSIQLHQFKIESLN